MPLGDACQARLMLEEARIAVVRCIDPAALASLRLRERVSRNISFFSFSLCLSSLLDQQPAIPSLDLSADTTGFKAATEPGTEKGIRWQMRCGQLWFVCTLSHCR